MYACLKCLAEYPMHRACCLVCGEFGLIAVLPKRAPVVEDDGAPQVATARELARAAWRVLASRAYPDLVLGVGAVVLAYGGPGAGKSTWCCRFLDGLRGPVVYVAAEERLGPAVSARLSRLGIRRQDYMVVAPGRAPALWRVARERRAVGIGLDAIQAMALVPADLRRGIEASGAEVLIAVTQVNKAGQPAGLQAWAHEADVVVAVEGGRWRTIKTRYGKPAMGDV